MLEIIKTRLWDMLKQKDVSLGMVFDETGRIHWNKGREITGKSVSEGTGFASSYIKESIKNNLFHYRSTDQIKTIRLLLKISGIDYQ